jgi:2-iminobutanoate/2-iminopropanoate deaminase
MNYRLLAIMALMCMAVLQTMPRAQTAPAFEKKSYNYSQGEKAVFPEVVTVTNPGRIIFLTGVGSEDENAPSWGTVLHIGDFMSQCLYAWDKVKRRLERQGASLSDVVRATTYITDIRFVEDARKCRLTVFGKIPQPAGTLANVSQLVMPGMLIEVEVTAVTAK